MVYFKFCVRRDTRLNLKTGSCSDSPRRLTRATISLKLVREQTLRDSSSTKETSISSILVGYLLFLSKMCSLLL